MPNHTKPKTNKYSIKIQLHFDMKTVSYFSQITFTSHISSTANLLLMNHQHTPDIKPISTFHMLLFLCRAKGYKEIIQENTIKSHTILRYNLIHIISALWIP